MNSAGLQIFGESITWPLSRQEVLLMKGLDGQGKQDGSGKILLTQMRGFDTLESTLPLHKCVLTQPQDFF